jgi:hypothetical protein
MLQRPDSLYSKDSAPLHFAIYSRRINPATGFRNRLHRIDALRRHRINAVPDTGGESYLEEVQPFARLDKGPAFATNVSHEAFGRIDSDVLLRRGGGRFNRRGGQS